MKAIEEIKAAIFDYGSFVDLATKLGESYGETYYYTPFEGEYRDLKDCIIGSGIPGIQRVNEPLTPEFLKTLDLAIFPDIGGGGLQRHLRDLGVAVWGAFGASNLELYRSQFIEVIKELELPLSKSIVIRGLSALAEHLKNVENVFIKVDRYRGNMETVRHRDYEHSRPLLDKLATEFGGFREHVTFVVQNEIETEIELGYDGWYCGGFPSRSYQGLELKNELYLGFLREYSELPAEVRFVNERFAPILDEYGYRNFFATELRIKEGVPFFIDPTLRMAGQTQEHLLENCENLAEVIWHGAHGELVDPKFKAPFAAEATLHYTAESENWKVLRIPEEVRPWVKLYQYAMDGDLYHFPPHAVDEVGVVIGFGEDMEQAIEHLKANLELLKDEPVSANVAGFAELLAQAETAEEEGVELSDGEVPDPAIVID